MTQPLPIPNKLADQSFKKPHFASMVKLSDQQELAVVDPKATRALIALMDMHAMLGGAASHYGGPAAFAELMSALHGYVFHSAAKDKKPWFDLFHIVNDAGHCENGLYALKANYEMAGLKLEALKKFRSMESPLTGHGEVHCFPQGVFLSNGPLGSAFPQTQGLAMADRLAGHDRVTICALSDGASMEGEAREAFAAIPGLAKAGKLAPYVLIVSDNNTKLSGRIDQDSFSMAPTFDSLKKLGWEVMHLEEGHNLQKCFDAISSAIEMARSHPQKPVVIHAKTTKGMGNKKKIDSASGGHGFALKNATELTEFIQEIYATATPPDIFKSWIEELVQIESKLKAQAVKDTGEKIQKGVSAALIRAKKEGLPVVSVTSDLPGSTGIAEFRKEFPGDSFDVGVAESNMISTATGFSKLGFIPVVDTFAQFGVTKGALPLTMASLSQSPIIAIFSHTGFQDAADGASHQALSYFAMTASIPHVQTYALSCSAEADALVSLAIKEFADRRKNGQITDSYIFFLGRENFPKNYGPTDYQLRKSQILLDTTKPNPRNVTIATAGSLVPQALLAAQDLQTQGIGALVVNCSCLNRFDEDVFKLAMQKTQGKLVTLEDHQLISGLGSYLSHQLSLKGYDFRIASLAVKNDFGKSSYNAADLYRQHHMDAQGIVEAALKL